MGGKEINENVPNKVHCRQCLLTEAQAKRSKGNASIFALWASEKKEQVL